MTTISASSGDNRRAIVRIIGHQMMTIVGSMARVHNGDAIEYLVFTAIWVLNSQHLVGDARYAELRNIPPNALRRPASLDELRRAVPMPDEILLSYVDRLVVQGIVERSAAGLVVPSAVFTQPEMLDGANELYVHVAGMVEAMREAGFSFGEAENAPDG